MQSLKSSYFVYFVNEEITEYKHNDLLRATNVKKI